ncbi:MAG: hypothetical protein RL015_3756 [Verrucomicrobiota bacterium]|jgi:hypothetical protein
METQQDIDTLAAAIYRDKVLRARALTADQKIRDGIECFDLSCRLMADGIRHQFKLEDEVSVWQKVRERLDIVRRLEERGMYQPTAAA